MEQATQIDPNTNAVSPEATDASARRAHDARAAGFTLIELVVTLVVLSILSVGVAPLVKTAVKRQREQQLREALREMRTAIDEFHRDTIGMDRLAAAGGAGGGGGVVGGGVGAGGGGGTPPIDPRSRVVITDVKLFTTENPDRYPPTLEDLVKGVNVIPRGGQVGGGGGAGLAGSGVSGTATSNELTLSTKKKVYLRKIPVDPMTGESEWELRSSYDEADAGTWGGENVFDVRSKSDDEALNGEKYSDW